MGRGECGGGLGYISDLLSIDKYYILDFSIEIDDNINIFDRD